MLKNKIEELEKKLALLNSEKEEKEKKYEELMKDVCIKINYINYYQN